MFALPKLLTMITYIEVWNAKEAWLDLSKDERSHYMAALGPAIQQLMASGVSIISWGANEAQTFERASYDFFAVWSFPGIESVKAFEQMVEGAGWYQYFEQVNLAGKTGGPQEVIEKLINL